MYNKLRKRFIILSMTIITAIILLVVGAINISNFSDVRTRADEVLETFVVKAYTLSPKPGQHIKDDTTIDSDIDLKRYRDERFFIVEKLRNNVYKCKLGFINTIKEESAIEYFKAAEEESSDKGYVDDFRYLKKGNRIYFLDSKQGLEAANRFLLFSSMFSVGGLVMFFVCLFFGSALIFKNVKDNDKKQQQFITDASHELKTPLMVISANNDLIEIKNGESEETKTIAKEIKQMNDMVKNLLTIAKANEVAKENIGSINLSLYLSESVTLFQPLFDKNSISLTVESDENVTIKSSNFLISETLKIIFDNAVKYAKTNVKITLKNNKKYVELTAINDSDFEEDKDLNYLTNRFVRDDKNAQNKNGSGIGLSLLKELVKKQKADLNICSKDKNYILSIKFK